MQFMYASMSVQCRSGSSRYTYMPTCQQHEHESKNQNMKYIFHTRGYYSKSVYNREFSGDPGGAASASVGEIPK